MRALGEISGSQTPLTETPACVFCFLSRRDGWRPTPHSCCDPSDSPLVSAPPCPPSLSPQTLVRPCACPRSVHPRCLARWQLRCAGRKEERCCRFCNAQLLPWWRALDIPDDASGEMKVDIGGNAHTFVGEGRRRSGRILSLLMHVVHVCGGGWLRVVLVSETTSPGRIFARPSVPFSTPVWAGVDGFRSFRARLLDALAVSAHAPLDYRFDCADPFSGESITLVGEGSYDAAVMCTIYGTDPWLRGVHRRLRALLVMSGFAYGPAAYAAAASTAGAAATTALASSTSQPQPAASASAEEAGGMSAQPQPPQQPLEDPTISFTPVIDLSAEAHQQLQGQQQPAPTAPPPWASLSTRAFPTGDSHSRPLAPPSPPPPRPGTPSATASAASASASSSSASSPSSSSSPAALGDRR